MRELHVRAADHADRLHDLERVALEALLQLLVNREERCRAVAVARVDAHRVDVLDEADGDHLVLGVADDLHLQLLPVEDRLLDEALVRERGVEAARADRAQLLHVVAEAAARAAHRVGGAHDHGVADLLVDELHGRLDGVDDAAAGRLDAELRHRLLEHLAVLAALDGVQVHADHLHAVLVQDALLREARGKIEAGLPAEIRQNGIRPLLRDDLLETFLVERLDVRGVRHHRVRHDGGRVGVHQYHLVPAGPEGLARLRARVVKLARLSNNDRPRSNDQNLVHVSSLHLFSLSGRASF